MIEIKKHSELSKIVKDELNQIIQNEFGHIPIVQETKWAIPDWTIIFYQDREIASFYNVVERIVTIDDRSELVAGINNVITTNKFRGKGLSTLTLETTKDFLFEELKSSLGLLLCADGLIPFYERLDWYKINCPVYFEQPTETKLWTANAMLLTKNYKLEPDKINLNGLPW